MDKWNSQEREDDPQSRIDSDLEYLNRVTSFLPPPEVLAEYEKVSPGTADRLISLAIMEIEERRRHLNQRRRISMMALVSALSIVAASLLLIVVFWSTLTETGDWDNMGSFDSVPIIVVFLTIILTFFTLIGVILPSARGKSLKSDSSRRASDGQR